MLLNTYFSNNRIGLMLHVTQIQLREKYLICEISLSKGLQVQYFWKEGKVKDGGNGASFSRSKPHFVEIYKTFFFCLFLSTAVQINL